MNVSRIIGVLVSIIEVLATAVVPSADSFETTSSSRYLRESNFDSRVMTRIFLYGVSADSGTSCVLVICGPEEHAPRAAKIKKNSHVLGLKSVNVICAILTSEAHAATSRTMTATKR
jgi:hypothetical protein